MAAAARNSTGVWVRATLLQTRLLMSAVEGERREENSSFRKSGNRAEGARNDRTAALLRCAVYSDTIAICNTNRCEEVKYRLYHA